MKDFVLRRKRKLSVQFSVFVSGFDTRQVFQEEIYESWAKKKKTKNGEQLTTVRNGKWAL